MSNIHVIKAVDEAYDQDKNVLKDRSKVKATSSHGYFHGHECHIKVEELTGYNLKMSPFRRFIFNLTCVRKSDVRALNLYRSYAALCAEKYRHYNNHSFTIHPFSKLRLYLEVFNFILMVMLSIYLPIYYSGVQGFLLRVRHIRSLLHWAVRIASEMLMYFENIHVEVIYFCDFIFINNIIANFLTGYIEGHTCKIAVFDLNKIAWHYIKTWLLVDILSSISFLAYVYEHPYDLVTFLLESAKLLRIPCTVKYLENILFVMKVSIYQKTAAEILFCIVMYLSWNIYFQFCVEYTIEGSFHPEHPRNCSWLTYGKLWNDTMPIRIVYALDRAVGMLTANTNMNIIKQSDCFEIYFAAAWLVSKFLVFHFAMKYIIVLFGTESARSKYYIMQKEIEHYMVQKKLGPRLKKKILKFYAIRFQSKYFTESRMLECVSGQLRDDILMHTGRQLVRELDFLKLLPRSLLMQIVFKLRVVIFIAGDIIIKINTVGDCLYFIDKGTVAIYSESGQEICHLEDGDFFGEIALVMSRFRTASAVAVTNCELFRLDKTDFESTIAYYPTVYENIREVAMNRYQTTCVLDEHNKADLKAVEGNELRNEKIN